MGKIIDALTKARIVYKVKGDEKEYAVTLLNFPFRIGKVFENKFKLRDNITDLWFKNFNYGGFLDVNNCKNVIISSKVSVIKTITLDHEGDSMGKVDVVLNLCDDNDKNVSQVIAKGAKYFSYVKDTYDELRVNNASLIEIRGNECNFDLCASGKKLEFLCDKVNMQLLSFAGDDVLIISSGKIKRVFLDDVSNLKVEGSSLESRDGCFRLKNAPNIIKSAWLFDQPLTYNRGLLGSHDDGFLLDDDTFSKDKGIDLGRAYLSYTLSQVLDKVNVKNSIKEKKFNGIIQEDIDEVKRYLDNLESQKSDFRNGLDEVKVKSYFKK